MSVWGCVLACPRLRTMDAAMLRWRSFQWQTVSRRNVDGVTLHSALVKNYYPAPPYRAAQYPDERVCLSVRLHAYLRNHTVIRFSTHAPCGRGSVLHWRLAVRHMYFRFCGWRHVISQWALLLPWVHTSPHSLASRSLHRFTSVTNTRAHIDHNTIRICVTTANISQSRLAFLAKRSNVPPPCRRVHRITLAISLT